MLLKSKEALNLSASTYDKLLAAGWFRGARFMNKPEYICVKGDLFSPVHVRLPLENHELSKSLRKINRINEDRFRWQMCPCDVDEESERLYKNQKEDFQAFIYPNLEEAILSARGDNSFRTFSIRVYDGDRLVAVSFFDVGQNSMASLLGLHDKAYTKESLGNFTILKEIEVAKRMGLKYYYPGYVLDDLKVFGYKLRFGKFQFKDVSRRWKPISQFEFGKTESALFKNKFNQLVQWLENNGMKGNRRIYPLHYAFNPGIDQSQFYRYPMYYELDMNNEKYAASFDPDKNTFVWSQIVKSPLHHRLLLGLELSIDLKTQSIYQKHLLEAVKEIHIPIEVLDQLEISSVTPTGQWSEPITSLSMKASFK
jgi:arginine-tRNA-protein transferase